MLIRDARPADGAFLIDCVIAEAMEAEALHLQRPTVQASVTAALENPALARYWIAEVDGAPVAAIAITSEWSDWRNAAYWYIQFVFVTEAQRGGEVLRTLVDHVREVARGEGAPELRLYVHPSNLRALRAYEKLGFAPLPYIIMARSAE